MATSVDPKVIGEHIRRLRSERRISVRVFATQTGFSPSFISQVENGQVSPSLASLHRIAESLGVTLGGFFAAAEARDETMIVRPGERRRLESGWSNAHLESLGVMTRRNGFEPVLAVFGPGGRTGKSPHPQAHEEFAFVLKGRMTLTLADERSELKPGDAVTLPARSPRLWENGGEEVAEVLMVSTRGVD